MPIKHLVFSGGGPTMVQTLGSVQHLEENGFIVRDEIETIYGTSAGMLVATLLCLKFDWETIQDYIIKRPWQDVFKIQVQNILDTYTKKGVFDISIIEKWLKPLFEAKDLSLSITLKEFYEYSKIELHFFTFEINEFKLHDVSCLNCPDLLLTQALLMTCSIPFLVTPVLLDGKCYVDGGVVCNYPLKYCLESPNKNESVILGFKNNYKNSANTINEESTMLDFILSVLFKTMYRLASEHVVPSTAHEVICDTELLTFQFLRTSLTSIEVRKDLWQSGRESAATFLKNSNSL
jgi:predicted acylesterase/phospholipase RssA